MATLDAIPARLDTSLVFPAPMGGVLSLENWRRREWAPAVEASGVRRPVRIYDLRSTFASGALAAGVTVFELARIMGTIVQMIERMTTRCSTAPPQVSPVASMHSVPSRTGARSRRAAEGAETAS